MNSIDLQIQSTASDGTHTPAEIVAMAKGAGVSTLALTDHDTVAGVAEAIAAGAEQSVRVIAGIEMSVEEHGLHILGYGIDYTQPALLEKLEEFKQGRMDGAKHMAENLKNFGFVIEWEDVLKQATGSVIARPHLARAVLSHPENKEKLQGAATVHEFIEKFLTDDNPNYVHRAHILAKDAIALINHAGGVAVWSHPAIHFRNDYDALEEMLKKLIAWGIEGVEVCNPSHTEDDVEYMESMAAKYNLLRTAGSDFHDAGNHRRGDNGLHSADFIGDYETYGFATDDIVARLDEAIARERDTFEKNPVTPSSSEESRD